MIWSLEVQRSLLKLSATNISYIKLSESECISSQKLNKIGRVSKNALLLFGLIMFSSGPYIEREQH